jgi:hypothetical protein
MMPRTKEMPVYLLAPERYTVTKVFKMATWCLQCGSCALSFADSVIPDNALWGIFFPPKPVLPVGGREFQCPHCGHSAVYESSDFIYRA